MKKGLVAAVALLGLALAWKGLAPAGQRAPGTRVRLAPATPAPFSRALVVRAFRLPEDHGPHFEFQTEWWYYTGNLRAGDGRRFGFQLTFFRRGLSPERPPKDGLATNQIYFAHLAVTDVAGSRHAFAERFSRGAAGLSGATAGRIWLEDWSATATNAEGSAVRLQARDTATSIELDLDLVATKPLVTHGHRGLSLKSADPGNASFYVGYTRMAARGRIGDAMVDGEAWFDHEWSTSALGAGAVGWDWWSLQLDDGRELMFFRIRREDGSDEPVSAGTLVGRDGQTRRLAREEVRIQVLEHWTSPETKADYPARWRLEVPTESLVLEVEPWVAGQEMRTSFAYWEGAVRVSGTSEGAPLAGRGYVELTGYTRSMQGVF